MKFNIMNYRGAYVMHCKTIEEAKSFCNYLDSYGRRWMNGDSYKECTEFCHYGDKTVYFFNMGGYGHIDKAVKNHVILEWSDFNNNEVDHTEDLMTNDVVIFRNGKKATFNHYLRAFSFVDWMDLKEINRDLTGRTNRDWDIVEVRRVKFCDGIEHTVYREAR